MKTIRAIHQTAGALGLLAAFFAAPRASAQESMIAMGNVDGAGNLDLEVNSLGAVVASSSLGTGNYQITVTINDAFIGATVDDFIVETTIEDSLAADTVASSQVSSVTDDIVTFNVRTMDVEESATPNAPVAVDEDFYFALRRVDVSATTLEGDSRFLLAAGNVDLGGALNVAFGVDGIEVSSVRDALGDYRVILTKEGSFSGDLSGQYLIFLTQIGTGTTDQAFRGDVVATASDDSVEFRVRSIDVQANVAADSGVADNDDFVFSIYRLVGDETTGNPSSRLISAIASVDGPTGNLVSGASVFGASTVSSSRLGVGVYTVTINAPGAFAGSDPDRFGAVVGIKGGITDRMAVADAVVTDDNTVTVQVVTHDVQTAGEFQGVVEDNDFYLVLYDLEPNLGPDLGIGTKKPLTTFKGFGTQNETGAGQGIRLNLTGTTQRKFFFASENTGDSIDGLRLKGIATAGPLETTFFRITGGKTNITAEVKTGSLVAEDVRPGETIRFEGRTAFKSETTRPTKTLKLRGTSDFQPSSRDLVKAKVVGK
jgi:hypothetical protein